MLVESRSAQTNPATEAAHTGKTQGPTFPRLAWLHLIISVCSSNRKWLVLALLGGGTPVPRSRNTAVSPQVTGPGMTNMWPTALGM
jgi:hypothetical protein